MHVENKDLKVFNPKSSFLLEVIHIETNITKIYTSLNKEARDLGIRQHNISLFLKDKRSKPYKAM